MAVLPNYKSDNWKTPSNLSLRITVHSMSLFTSDLLLLIQSAATQSVFLLLMPHKMWWQWEGRDGKQNDIFKNNIAWALLSPTVLGE